MKVRMEDLEKEFRPTKQRRSPQERAADLELSPYQQRVLGVPEEFDVFMGGGRGGSKSFTMALIAIRHLQQYGEHAYVLYVRRTYAAMRDFEAILNDLVPKMCGAKSRYNSALHVWTLPNGAKFELGQLKDINDFNKYQGRSITMLLLDEISQYPTPALLDKLRSSLRARRHVITRVVMGANPGGSGGAWVAKRYALRSPWVPYEDKHGIVTVTCPSTYLDNPFIDQEAYKKDLEAATETDPQLRDAWLTGNWSTTAGGFFESVLSEKRSSVEKLSRDDVRQLLRDGWRSSLSMDYGSSAPCIVYLILRSPGALFRDRYFPRNSILAAAELAFHEEEDLDRGLELTVAQMSEEIVEFCEEYGVQPHGVADDSIFATHGHVTGSIADEFRRYGCYFHPAGKGRRRDGWNLMKQALMNAGKPDKPGLYISDACRFAWETLPFLQRDKRRPDDLDTRACDHAADTLRYAMTGSMPQGGVRRMPF